MRMAEWVRLIRAEFKPGEPQPCEVCGGYKCVAEAHHIYPLAWQFADRVRHEERQLMVIPDQSFAWLCPTHHALVHYELSRFRRRVYCDHAPLNNQEWECIYSYVQRFANLYQKYQEQMEDAA